MTRKNKRKSAYQNSISFLFAKTSIKDLVLPSPELDPISMIFLTELREDKFLINSENWSSLISPGIKKFSSEILNSRDPTFFIKSLN